MSDDLLALAGDSVQRALKAGAHEAAAGTYRSREVRVRWRDGSLEELTEATTRGLGLHLYVDQRYAAFSTLDLRPDALEQFIADAVSVTRALAQDQYRSLPDPSLYAGRASVDLQIDDPASTGLTVDQRRDAARTTEAAARGVKGSEQIISVTSGFADNRVEECRVHSNGFSGSSAGTYFSIYADVSVKDPSGRKPEESWSATTRFLAALPAAAEVGRRAGERALARIGSKKTASAVLPMVVDNRAGGRLVSVLLQPLQASTLQQKRSCLEGKIGAVVGSRLLDLADTPLLPKGLGSRHFDSEGIAARTLPIFEAGVLRSYYVDDYYGRKLAMKPTTGSQSNLSWKTGDANQAALIGGIQSGIFVNGFLGGNSNSVTGDFSLGVQGFRIEKGQLTEPISEMNISGNVLTFWNRLTAVGNDPWEYSMSRTPTLVFDGVQFAGT